MSVRDKIKMFEKSNVLQTAAASLKRRGSNSISSSVASISPNSSPVHSRVVHTPPEASRRHSNQHDSPDSVPDSQMTSPPRDNSPRVDPCCLQPHPGTIPEECPHGEDEYYYYEVDAEFCKAVAQYGLENTLDHSIILNKPFFPKPCLYTE